MWLAAAAAAACHVFCSLTDVALAAVPLELAVALVVCLSSAFPAAALSAAAAALLSAVHAHHHPATAGFVCAPTAPVSAAASQPCVLRAHDLCQSRQHELERPAWCRPLQLQHCVLHPGRRAGKYIAQYPCPASLQRGCKASQSARVDPAQARCSTQTEECHGSEEGIRGKQGRGRHTWWRTQSHTSS